MNNDVLHVTMHDFKTNLARYIRKLERGDVRYIALCRRNMKRPVAIIGSLGKKKNEEKPS